MNLVLLLVIFGFINLYTFVIDFRLFMMLASSILKIHQLTKYVSDIDFFVTVSVNNLVVLFDSNKKYWFFSTKQNEQNKDESIGILIGEIYLVIHTEFYSNELKSEV